jgi:hypothetical protein
MLTQVLRDSPRPLQSSITTLPLLGHEKLPSTSFPFHYPLIILPLDAIFTLLHSHHTKINYAVDSSRTAAVTCYGANNLISGVQRSGGGGWRGSNPPPPPKFRRPSKIVPNSTRLSKLLNIAEFRTPTTQDVRKKGSKILKLPPVRNRFILAMTNKLVVIIVLKYQKLRNFYYMK